MKLLPKLKVKIIIVLSTIILLVSTVLFLPWRASTIFPQKVVASAKLTDASYYQGLNVEQLETYMVPDSWGTAVFIPQYHRSTGSDAQDSVNDIGVKSQEQIYKIEHFLNGNGGVNLFMTEGSLYGEVPAEKIVLLSDKIKKRDRFAVLCDKLKIAFKKESLNPSLEKKLLSTLEGELKKIDREIILEGAAEKLKAEGKDIKLYGAEDKETLNDSRKIVGDYIYLSDRIEQLDNPSKDGKRIAINNLQNYLSLLGKGISNRILQPAFKPLESDALSQGKKDLAKLIKDTADIFYQLDNTPRKVIVTESPNTPARKDNPYQDINSQKELKKRLSSVKAQMQDVVIDRRSRDAAQNFATALKSEYQTVGVLQYGAGHKEGLVKELNSRGLNVIVVTPSAVLDKQSLRPSA